MTPQFETHLKRTSLDQHHRKPRLERGTLSREKLTRMLPAGTSSLNLTFDCFMAPPTDSGSEHKCASVSQTWPLGHLTAAYDASILTHIDWLHLYFDVENYSLHPICAGALNLRRQSIEFPPSLPPFLSSFLSFFFFVSSDSIWNLLISLMEILALALADEQSEEDLGNLSSSNGWYYLIPLTKSFLLGKTKRFMLWTRYSQRGLLI